MMNKLIKNEKIPIDENQIKIKLEEVLEKIRNCVHQQNNWIERNEICDILKFPKNGRLVEGRYNSKIGQLLYNFLRKEDFEYKKVQLDVEDNFNYEIWVSPAGMPKEKLISILNNKHNGDFVIVDKPSFVTKKNKTKKPQTSNYKAEMEDDEAQDNEYLNKITELIKQGENIFITGYAGTGKSYLLNKLKKRFKIDVTSTTGLAAVNVQGQTIHSWAGVGICNKPINLIVENILKRMPLKKKIINSKILAIDEISMLDAKTFDYIDTVLKTIRNNDKPFGGIQVLLFGDFFQLPPVNKENGFCFQSSVWQQLNLKTIFLEKIYRQDDLNFVNSLNNMRLNQLTDEDMRLFCTREVDYDTQDSDILHIFSTNKEADNYNSYKFKSVKNEMYKFLSIDKIHRKTTAIEVNKEKLNKKLTKYDLMTWEIFDKSCKAVQELELKINCKVMLLKNLDFKKGLINGSCGTVQSIEKSDDDDDLIFIKFENGVEELISKHTFEVYKDGELLVSREQYPLRLAYGITIHKSQGMTLEKLVVDCNRIFECGQAYVALSRIKSIEGLYLKSFNPNKILTDEQVVNFYESLNIN